MEAVAEADHIIVPHQIFLSFSWCTGDDGDCMYIILRGSCNVHVDPDFDETAQAGALQKASLAPKVIKKKQPLSTSSVAKHLLRPTTGHMTSLDRLSSSVSSRSDMSGTFRRSLDGAEAHSRRASGIVPGSMGEQLIFLLACSTCMHVLDLLPSHLFSFGWKSEVCIVSCFACGKFASDNVYESDELHCQT